MEGPREHLDPIVAAWAESVLGPVDVRSHFSHAHGNAELWRLESRGGTVWLKMHARRDAWSAEVNALGAWGRHVGRTPLLVAVCQSPDAILITEAEGVPAKSLGWEGTATERLWMEAGAWLSKLHQISNDWFGGVSEVGARFADPDTEVVSYQQTHWERVLADASQSGLFDDADLKFAAGIATRGLEALEGERPCAVHGDFSPRNWFAHPSGELSGVIDFEHSHWGCRAFDLCFPYNREFVRNPRLEPAFLQGYGPISAQLREQIAAFRAILALRQATWAATVGSHEFAQENVEALRRQQRSI